MQYTVSLSQTIGLALDGLEQLLLEDMVRGVERDTHTLTAGGGHREGVRVTAAYYI